jgi:hypothetical protein
MNATLVAALFTLWLFVFPAYAQSPCVECLKTSQNEMRMCLANAISEEDKLTCEDQQEEQAKVCEDSECRIEREEAEARKEGTPQGK